MHCEEFIGAENVKRFVYEYSCLTKEKKIEQNGYSLSKMLAIKSFSMLSSDNGMEKN